MPGAQVVGKPARPADRSNWTCEAPMLTVFLSSVIPPQCSMYGSFNVLIYLHSAKHGDIQGEMSW